MTKQELTYWVTLSLIPKIWTKRKNEIYVKCFRHKPQISILELFDNSTIWDIVGLSDTEKEQFIVGKAQLANNSFLVEDMLAQGYDILPITHPDYPRLLKYNLKYNAPTVIYTKGNKLLLQEPAIAIVGSRHADAISLTFTDNIAKKATSENKLVVSGFAKGVDRQALDAAVEANGKSIIVLPQGIMTFSSGFKQYFKHIAQGRVLVMSTFAPKAPWSVEFAMARNPIIYAMASETYVAQSDNKGGTWSGVIDALRKGRIIYVRYPEDNETNANLLLIQKGATAVDITGRIINPNTEQTQDRELFRADKVLLEIIALLKTTDLITAKEMIERLHLNCSVEKLKRYINKTQTVETIKINRRIYIRLKINRQLELFNERSLID